MSSPVKEQPAHSNSYRQCRWHLFEQVQSIWCPRVFLSLLHQQIIRFALLGISLGRLLYVCLFFAFTVRCQGNLFVNPYSVACNQHVLSNNDPSETSQIACGFDLHMLGAGAGSSGSMAGLLLLHFATRSGFLSAIPQSTQFKQ